MSQLAHNVGSGPSSLGAVFGGVITTVVIAAIVLALATAMGIRIDVRGPASDAGAAVIAEAGAVVAAPTPGLQDRLDNLYLRSIATGWDSAAAPTPGLQDRLDNLYLRSIATGWGE